MRAKGSVACEGKLVSKQDFHSGVHHETKNFSKYQCHSECGCQLLPLY